MVALTIDVLIQILIGGLVVWGAHWILGMLGLPDVPKKIVLVIIALFVVLWLLQLLGIVA